MKRTRRMIAWLVTAALGFGCLSACNRNKQPSVTGESTLSVGYTAFGGVYSPFYAEMEADRAVVELTQLSLLTTDREGQVVLDGINGETKTYNGTDYTYDGVASVTVITNDDNTVDYEITLRQGIKFSDGKPLTADDVLFTMYVLCDPTYDGPRDFASLPIAGLQEYRNEVTPKWKLILNDTPKTAAVGSPQGYYTSAEALDFWGIFNKAGADFVQEMVDAATPADEQPDVTSVAAAMGYPDLPEVATAADLFHAIVDRHGYDISYSGIDTHRQTTSFAELLKSRLTDGLLCGVDVGQSADHIAGLVKTGDYSLRMTLTEYHATALHQLCIPIAPMHYYGNPVLSEEEQTAYGFTKGDLSTVRAKNGAPLGAGAYCLDVFGVVTVKLKANPSYYRGCAKIDSVYLKRTVEADGVPHMADGTVDVMVMPYSKTTVYALEKANGGVLSGDVLAAKAIGTNGDGYIGISASAVKVGDDPYSPESRALRTAFAMLFSYYRLPSLEEYYAKQAAEPTAWLPAVEAPLPDFFRRYDGTPVFTGTEATEKEKQDAVLRAALGYFKAAGYTVENGKVTAAPIGASLTYRIWFNGNGTVNHPVYAAAQATRELLFDVGVTLILRNVTYQTEIQNGIVTGQVGMWYDELPTTTEADIYSRYFSGNVTRPAGGMAYQLDVQDDEVNRLIEQAMREPDEQERISLYAQGMQRVSLWATEVPFCQNSRMLVYRAGTLQNDTVPRDITPHYSWLREISSLTMLPIVDPT